MWGELTGDCLRHGVGPKERNALSERKSETTTVTNEQHCMLNELKDLMCEELILRNKWDTHMTWHNTERTGTHGSAGRGEVGRQAVHPT